MANPISIAHAEDVESLRRATEVAVNRHITQQNKTDHSFQTHINANGFKVQNLGNPAGQKDAVPLDYLNRALKKLKAASSPSRRQAAGTEHGLAHYGLGVGFPVAVGTDIPPHHIVAIAGTFEAAYINAKIPAVGADLIIDVQKWDGATWSSIFSTTKLVLPDGSASTDVATQTTFAVASVAIGDLLRADVVQIGSSDPGTDISVMVRWLAS